MTTGHVASGEKLADPAATSHASEWVDLAQGWRLALLDWSTWWTRGAEPVSSSAPNASKATTRNVHPEPRASAMTASATKALASAPTVAVDPAAVLALSERYRREFEMLWANFTQGRMDGPASTPPEDPRFSAPAWGEYPYFAWLKNAYLLYANYVRELAFLAQSDGDTHKRLIFAANQYVDALAPSNFLASNPDALRRAFETNGASISRGLANLLFDSKRGRIAMTDESAFAVGRNLAVTPGSVVFRNELIELIQYAPTTQHVFRRPLLIVPPCINKFYILDLQPENSFVRYAVGEGHTVFMISWRNIPATLGKLEWDDYIEDGVLAAIRVAREISHGTTINALGFCVGGTMLASALAVLAARGGRHLATVTLLATMLDFRDPGDIGVYISPDALAARERALLNGERIRGSELAGAFASLRSNDLVWHYVVANYLKGETPPAFDLLYWNSDSTNLPGPMYVYYLRNMYIDNLLRVANSLTMCGETIDLQRIAVPSYVLATRDDHIVPWRSAYKTNALLGSDATFVLAASGHIAGVINHPAKRRRSYWTNKLLAEDADEWLSGAEMHSGSWWGHWAAWLREHAGSKREPPAQAGDPRYPPLSAAPGAYVAARAE